MVILILIGIIPCLVGTGMVVRGYRNRAVSLREISVKNQCEILRDFLTTEAYLDNPDSDIINNELSMLSNIYNGRILIVDSDFRVVKDTYDIDTGKTSVTKEVVSTFTSGKGTSSYDDRNSYILMTFPLSDASGVAEGVMLVSVSTNEIVQNARVLENMGLVIVVLVMLAVLFIGYFLSGWLVKPFVRVTHAIEDVTDGYEDEAISVPDYTETVAMTTAFNQMLSRVRQMDNSRQEFVSNVSHELKTPLTSMKVLADSLNGQEGLPIEIYQEFMQDITQEIDRENKIISDLLSMVRMDKKAASLNIEECAIQDLLNGIVKRLRPIAENNKITLIMEPMPEVYAEVDESKLSLAFSNLIENGIKYNVEGGWVRVSMTSDRKYFYVTVADCGVGIPADQQEHIYERFYRGDKSHSTTIEGTGLGLAIARSAIVLHRGVIKVNSKEGEGTTFQVRIPLKHQR
ncbi:MAG: HAMP domain-containing sensor histidine kinase [Lachnospiraceae bacterium]|nr:HAMP domain-containing sensor histidine kinase [Lachnospiraceae bacterium]